MSRYRYWAETLRSPLTLLGEMPLTGVTYGKTLNGVGEISAMLPLSADFEVASAQVDATRRWRVIHVDRDHRIMGTYVWWARNYNQAARTLMLRGAELWSLVRRIAYLENIVHPEGTDQATIVNAVLTWLLAQPGADFGFTITTPLTGRQRKRVYQASEQKPCGEVIEQLAKVIDGFDWSLETYWAGDTIARDFQLHYPRAGRRASQNALMIEVGAAGVQLGTFEENATDASTRHTAIGAGDGDAMLVSTVTDTDAISRGDPLLDSTESLKDVTDLATLRAHADQGLFDHRPLAGIPSVVIPADGPPELGVYTAGDDIRIRIAPARDPFWPGGLDMAHRILAWKAKPPTDGELERVELTLGPVAA